MVAILTLAVVALLTLGWLRHRHVQRTRVARCQCGKRVQTLYGWTRRSVIHDTNGMAEHDRRQCRTFPENDWTGR